MAFSPRVMLLKGPVPDHPSKGAGAWEAMLPKLGFNVQATPDPGFLYTCLADLEPSPPPVAVILAAQAGVNLAVLSYLRALYPALPILVVVPQYHEQLLAQVVVAGADMYCNDTAETSLVSTMLARMITRAGLSRALAGPLSRDDCPEQQGVWRLEGRGATLVTPDGTRLQISPNERAFLATLFNAVNHKAAHADLAYAITRHVCDPVPSAAVLGHLGVVTSRLRRKLERQGFDLPVRSVHKWGYVFTAACRVPDPVIMDLVQGRG